MSIASEALLLTEIATPATQADVAIAIRQASARDDAVYPIGGGTSLDCGLTPKRSGIGLALSGLAQVVDYPARDMTITVEAGITLAALGQIMAQQRQWLPVDAAEAERATLGGLIATNASGPRRYGRGTIRDYVIGLSAVDGHGTSFKSGGRVVKNVAGYDFCKLLTGSQGTLAVITQVTLKVRPVVERSAFVCAEAIDLDHAEQILQGLVHSKTTPVAIELLQGACWDEVLSARPGRPQIVVGLEGTDQEVTWSLAELAREWNSLSVMPVEITETDAVAQLWRALTDFSSDRTSALVIKANVLPSQVTKFVHVVLNLDPQAAVQSHAGDGIVIARFSEIPAGGLGNTMIKCLQPAASAGQGSAIVIRCPGASDLTHQAMWGPPPADLGLMRAVKQQFDPRGILNPGRFVY